MKKIFILLLTVSIIACNNNKPNETTLPGGNGKEKDSIDVKHMQNAADQFQKQKDILETLTPLSLDELKTKIPESLLGTTGINVEANDNMGAGLAIGEYEISDTSRITLSIYDCAGPAGAGIYSMQFMGLMNIQEENDEEYTKTIDFKGSKAYEHCNKSDNECTITYFTGNRFLVTLQGQKVSATALKDAARRLNIK